MRPSSLSVIRSKIDRHIQRAANGCIDHRSYRRELDALLAREEKALQRLRDAHPFRAGYSDGLRRAAELIGARVEVAGFAGHPLELQQDILDEARDAEAAS
jgi:hypothetical protein